MIGRKVRYKKMIEKKLYNFIISNKNLGLEFIHVLVYIKNIIYNKCKLHLSVLKNDGLIIYFKFFKNDVDPVFLVYSIYFLSRGCICLSMLPLRVIEDEISVSNLTNAVINNVVKNTNMEENIVSIPSQSLEKKLPHDINIYNISKNNIELYEIKVLLKKDNISMNELVYYRFQYPYIKYLYIGYDLCINDIEIVKNIDKINEEEDIYRYLNNNFEENRIYHRNKFLFSVKKDIMSDICKECNLNIDINRTDFVKMINQNDNNIRIVDNRINQILENKNKIDNITNITKNLLNKEYLTQKDVFHNEEEFTPIVKGVKVDLRNSQHSTNDVYKTGNIDECKYDNKIIKKRNIFIINLLSKLKKK